MELPQEASSIRLTDTISRLLFSAQAGSFRLYRGNLPTQFRGSGHMFGRNFRRDRPGARRFGWAGGVVAPLDQAWPGGDGFWGLGVGSKS